MSDTVLKVEKLYKGYFLVRSAPAAARPMTARCPMPLPSSHPRNTPQLGSGPATVRNQRATPAHLLAAALHRSPQLLTLPFPLPLPCLLPWSILWPLLVPPALWRQGQQMHPPPLLLAGKRAGLVLSATSTAGLPPSRLFFIKDRTSHLRFLVDTGAEVRYSFLLL